MFNPLKRPVLMLRGSSPRGTTNCLRLDTRPDLIRFPFYLLPNTQNMLPCFNCQGSSRHVGIAYMSGDLDTYFCCQQLKPEQRGQAAASPAREQEASAIDQSSRQ